MLKSNWWKANKDITDLKNDNGSDEDETFQCVCNLIFNFMASGGCHIAVLDLMMYIMHNNNKKPATMSPKISHTLTLYQNRHRLGGDVYD